MIEPFNSTFRSYGTKRQGVTYKDFKTDGKLVTVKGGQDERRKGE